MWPILNGTIVNAVSVAIGSLLGVRAGRSLKDRYRSIVLQCLGLVTICLGIDAGVLRFAETTRKFGPLVDNGQTYGARLAMAMIASLILGALIGTALRIHERIESMGGWIHRQFSGTRFANPGGATRNSTSGPTPRLATEETRQFGGCAFAEGFLTASVIFCVGPLTLLGCLQNGAHGDPSYLYIKSVLDGFCSFALASSLGWGVVASVVIVLFFQGGLAILAHGFAEPLDELSLALMTIVGGIVLLATALMILEIKRIPVANLLPAIFLPPLIIWLAQTLQPGILLPVTP